MKWTDVKPSSRGGTGEGPRRGETCIVCMFINASVLYLLRLNF